MPAHRAVLLVLLSACAEGSQVSPVQKVIQLLDELKAKIVSDVAKDSAEMQEYAAFCNENLREKGYAIKTASQSIEDLQAQIEDSKATILESSDDIQELSTTIAGKEQELAASTKQRKVQREDFEFAEKQLLKSVAETEHAIAQVSSGMSFLQAKQAIPAGLQEALQAILSSSAIIGGASEEKLRSLMQMQTSANTAVDESNDLSLKAALAQPEQKNFESQSGGILDAIKGMKEKTEGQLEELRKQEMKDGFAFDMLEDGLKNEIKNLREKHGAATALNQSATQALAGAEGELGETQKTKADDQKYMSTLTIDFGTKSEEWEERHKSAVGEMGALDTAREILVKGVTALVQVSSKKALRKSSDRDQRLRSVTILRNLGRRYHSFALVELATSAATDPFVKIRGLIEDMIAKLQAEAAEEASHKAFCDEEMAKSAASKQDKEAKADNHQARMSEATAEIAQLTEAVKELQSEVAEIDKAQAEATALRNQEKTANTQSMKDFSGSADAVIAAIGALKSYYEGASLLQVKSKTSVKQPKTDAANNIISVLEAAESEFTQLHAETEAAETSAQHSYEELTQENKVAKAQKEADAKSKESNVKSLTVSLSHHTEDHAAVSQELAAVNAYIEKLKPECETKVESYADRKAAREAEIEGLKEALSILEG